jgi:hypothetical protein
MTTRPMCAPGVAKGRESVWAGMVADKMPTPCIYRSSCMRSRDIAHRLGVSGWKGGTEPRPDAVRAAAKANHNFVNLNADGLFHQILNLACPLHDSEEPKKRTPKGIPERSDHRAAPGVPWPSTPGPAFQARPARVSMRHRHRRSLPTLPLLL